MIVAVDVVHEIGRALSFAFGMLWEILWALILGFVLSAMVQAVVSKRTMTRLLPDDSPRSLAVATGLGAASSSCSYAAVALARSIFRKGADFTAAMAFEFASTNLVIELGIILALLMGWQFTLGEFVGGPLMIVFIALLFRVFLKSAGRGGAPPGRQGPARLDGGPRGDGHVGHRGRLDLAAHTSPQGFTAISHSFVMDWAAVWKDIFGGLLIAGALAAWVPESFWQSFFFVDHPVLLEDLGTDRRDRSWRSSRSSARSATCPRGRALERRHQLRRRDRLHLRRPHRAADPQHLPQVLRLAHDALPARHFYVTMVAAGFVVELLFGALGITPTARDAKVVEASVTWNYTTVLNIIFLALAALLLWRFFRTRGLAMLRMMNKPMDEGGHDHGHAQAG